MSTKIQKGEFTGAVTFIFALTFMLFVGWALSGCSSDCGGGAFSGSCVGIGEPQPDELVCRTIEVDQCFAVQCGYAFGTPDVEIVANELFCPEDYLTCDYTCTNTVEVCDEPVECEEPDVVEPGDDGYCDLSVPVGHRPIECRGKDHAR